jgi:hypothetical protein
VAVLDVGKAGHDDGRFEGVCTGHVWVRGRWRGEGDVTPTEGLERAHLRVPILAGTASSSGPLFANSCRTLGCAEPCGPSGGVWVSTCKNIGMWVLRGMDETLPSL